MQYYKQIIRILSSASQIFLQIFFQQKLFYSIFALCKSGATSALEAQSENIFGLAIFQHFVYDSRSDELNQFHQNQNHDH